MHFDNSTSERINNDIEALSPPNDSPIVPAQVFIRSKSARETRGIKKQKRNYNSKITCEVDNKGYQQRSGMKMYRLQQNTINKNSNPNNNQSNDKIRM